MALVTAVGPIDALAKIVAQLSRVKAEGRERTKTCSGYTAQTESVLNQAQAFFISISFHHIHSFINEFPSSKTPLNAALFTPLFLRPKRLCQAQII
jgi:hypothetical protein